MARIPKERQYCIAALKKLAKRKDVGGPTILAAVDRIAHLDGLYKVELVRPKERPDKWADTKPVSLPEPSAPAEDVEAKRLVAEFNAKHYGGENVGTKATPTTAPDS